MGAFLPMEKMQKNVAMDFEQDAKGQPKKKGLIMLPALKSKAFLS